MNKNTNTVELDLEDNITFGTSTKKLDEEIRIPVKVTSVALLGNEVYRDKASGAETINYKIGIGFTSNIRCVGEDGVETEGFYEFYMKVTATASARGALMLSGLPEAVGMKTFSDLKQLVNGLIGKQVTAMTKYRPYKDKKGNDKIAVELEKFKAPVKEADFSEVDTCVHVPFLVGKYSTDKKIVVIVEGKPEVGLVSKYVKTAPVEGSVEIDDVC